jgi:outer membrane lipoprotein-sorting protein
MIRSWLKFSALLAGIVAISPIASAQSDDDLPNLLKQAIEAAKKLKYSGVRRVQLRFGPDVVQHTEYILKDGMRTRIWFPDEGSFRGQIIVENEGERRHYFPDKSQIEIMPPRREEHLGRFGKFGKGPFKTEFRIEDGGQIANISTKKIEVVGPKNTVFIAMWIDPKSGLVLKRVFYNRKGEQQASSEFTKVDLRPEIKRGDFDLNIRGAKVITPRDRLAELVQRGSFQNVSFPPKDPLKLESVRIQRIDDISALVQVYVRKDGRVSLFQLKATIDPGRLQKFGRGERLSAYSWQRNGASFVLLGDMPENKLRELGQRLGG